MREGESTSDPTPSPLPPSHQPTLKKASMSPMAGIYSGMNGFNLVSRSTVWGVYLIMCWNSSFSSLLTGRCSNSAGSYALLGRGEGGEEEREGGEGERGRKEERRKKRKGGSERKVAGEEENGKGEEK